MPLFANDRADLAQLAGATGVHLGQEDLPPELARAVDPGLRVGLSTHDDAELDAALGELPGYVDYVAIGPIFETRSKDRPSPIVGVAALAVRAARVRAARPALPIVAIGGVDAERIAALAPLVDAVAIIGALLPRASDADPYDAAGAAQALDLAGRIAAAQGSASVSLMLLMAATAFFAASMGFSQRRAGGKTTPTPTGRAKMRRWSERPVLARAARRPRPPPSTACRSQVGDVVLGNGEERWLRGRASSRARRGRVIGALFVAPEGAVQHGVAAFVAPRREVFWLAPAAVDATGEPPATLELGGVVLRRKGRLCPSRSSASATGAPRVEEGIWAEYEAGGRDVALVVTGGGGCFAFCWRAPRRGRSTTGSAPAEAELRHA